MIAVRATLVALALSGCVTPEQAALNRQRSAEQQQAAAEVVAAAIVERCQSFGYQRGTEGFANCVATEVRAIEGRMQASSCESARRDAYYWCRGPGRSQSVLAGYNCPQAEQRVRQSC